MTISIPSASDRLSFEETVARLKASPQVDGLAEFGSHARSQASTASDYDVMVLAKALPAPVFQMVSSINGRLADILLIPIELVDHLLADNQLPGIGSFDDLFLQKMRTARILSDESGRLRRIQRWLVGGDEMDVLPPGKQHQGSSYTNWFWQSFGLLHLERMVQSADPIYQSAFDMMFTACLSGTWRSYFEIRQISWEGEKAAVRYWQAHDPDYLQTLRECLERQDRNQKLELYRKLVERALEPIGQPLIKGETAVILREANDLEAVQKTLQYWQAMLEA